MNVWEFLHERGERRFLREADLIERGLDSRSMLAGMGRTFDARMLIAGSIITLFAVAFLRESDKDTRNLMVGALIAAFAGAWGYYLGSSSGATKAHERADAGLQIAQDTVQRLLPPPPPRLPEPQPEMQLDELPADEKEAAAAGAKQATDAAGQVAQRLDAAAHAKP